MFGSLQALTPPSKAFVAGRWMGDSPRRGRFGGLLGAMRRNCVVACMTVPILSVSVTNMAQAVPPDPQRPFDAKSCKEALMRLEEAQQGSPLISPEENREVLRKAVEQVLRLCKNNAD